MPAWPSRLESLFLEVVAKLEAIKTGDYHYAGKLNSVERQILNLGGEEDSEVVETNTLHDAPKILVYRGANTRAPDDETLDLWTRHQEFEVLFELKSGASCEDVGKAIADMMKALFATPWSSISREWEFDSINLSDPETQMLLTGPSLTFSVIYSERIGDPTTE